MVMYTHMTMFVLVGLLVVIGVVSAQGPAVILPCGGVQVFQPFNSSNTTFVLAGCSAPEGTLIVVRSSASPSERIVNMSLLVYDSSHVWIVVEAVRLVSSDITMRNISALTVAECDVALLSPLCRPRGLSLEAVDAEDCGFFILDAHYTTNASLLVVSNSVFRRGGLTIASAVLSPRMAVSVAMLGVTCVSWTLSIMSSTFSNDIGTVLNFTNVTLRNRTVIALDRCVLQTRSAQHIMFDLIDANSSYISVTSNRFLGGTPLGKSSVVLQKAAFKSESLVSVVNCSWAAAHGALGPAVLIFSAVFSNSSVTIQTLRTVPSANVVSLLLLLEQVNVSGSNSVFSLSDMVAEPQTHCMQLSGMSLSEHALVSVYNVIVYGAVALLVRDALMTTGAVCSVSELHATATFFAGSAALDFSHIVLNSATLALVSCFVSGSDSRYALSLRDVHCSGSGGFIVSAANVSHSSGTVAAIVNCSVSDAATLTWSGVALRGVLPMYVEGLSARRGGVVSFAAVSFVATTSWYGVYVLSSSLTDRGVFSFAACDAFSSARNALLFVYAVLSNSSRIYVGNTTLRSQQFPALGLEAIQVTGGSSIHVAFCAASGPYAVYIQYVNLEAGALLMLQSSHFDTASSAVDECNTIYMGACTAVDASAIILVDVHVFAANVTLVVVERLVLKRGSKLSLDECVVRASTALTLFEALTVRGAVLVDTCTVSVVRCALQSAYGVVVESTTLNVSSAIVMYMCSVNAHNSTGVLMYYTHMDSSSAFQIAHSDVAAARHGLYLYSVSATGSSSITVAWSVFRDLRTQSGSMQSPCGLSAAYVVVNASSILTVVHSAVNHSFAACVQATVLQDGSSATFVSSTLVGSSGGALFFDEVVLGRHSFIALDNTSALGATSGIYVSSCALLTDTSVVRLVQTRVSSLQDAGMKVISSRIGGAVIITEGCAFSGTTALVFDSCTLDHANISLRDASLEGSSSGLTFYSTELVASVVSASGIRVRKSNTSTDPFFVAVELNVCRVCNGTSVVLLLAAYTPQQGLLLQNTEITSSSSVVLVNFTVYPAVSNCVIVTIIECRVQHNSTLDVTAVLQTDTFDVRDSLGALVVLRLCTLDTASVARLRFRATKPMQTGLSMPFVSVKDVTCAKDSLFVIDGYMDAGGSIIHATQGASAVAAVVVTRVRVAQSSALRISVAVRVHVSDAAAPPPVECYDVALEDLSVLSLANVSSVVVGEYLVFFDHLLVRNSTVSVESLNISGRCVAAGRCRGAVRMQNTAFQDRDASSVEVSVVATNAAAPLLVLESVVSQDAFLWLVVSARWESLPLATHAVMVQLANSSVVLLRVHVAANGFQQVSPTALLVANATLGALHFVSSSPAPYRLEFTSAAMRKRGETDSSIVARFGRSAVLIDSAEPVALQLDASTFTGYAQLLAYASVVREVSVEAYCSWWQDVTGPAATGSAYRPLVARCVAGVPFVSSIVVHDYRASDPTHQCFSHTQSHSVSPTDSLFEVVAARAEPRSMPLARAASLGVLTVASVVLPTAGLTSRRMQLLWSAANCDTLPSLGEVLESSVDAFTSPTQLQLGSAVGASHRGAVVGNVAVCVCLFAIAAALVLAVACAATPLNRRCMSRQSLLLASGRLRVPGLCWVLVCLLLQPTLTSALLLLRSAAASSSPPADDAAVGLLGVLLTVISLGGVAVVLGPRQVKFQARSERITSTYELKAALGQSVVDVVVAWCAAPVRGRDVYAWAPRLKETHFVERWGHLFDGCRQGRHWWALLDAGFSCAFASIGAVTPDTEAACKGVLWGLVFLSIAQCLALFVWMPYQNRLDTGIGALLCGLQVAVSLCVALGAPADTTEVIATVTSVAVMIAAGIAFVVVKLHMRRLLSTLPTQAQYLSTKKQRLSRPAPPVQEANQNKSITVSQERMLESLIKAACNSSRRLVVTVAKVSPLAQEFQDCVAELMCR